MEQNLGLLTNLINYKMNLNLNEPDCAFIIDTYFVEKRITYFSMEFSRLENPDINSLANLFLKLSPERETDRINIEQFYECLSRKNIGCDKIEFERTIAKFRNEKKIKEFEEKLKRNTDIRPTIEDLMRLNGFDFEKFIAGLFEKAGYTVEITKKTGDQGADIIVTKNGVSTAVQAKRYSGSVGNKAVQEVVAAMKYYDCDGAIVITTAEFTKSAFELARVNKVQLIDKEGLSKLLDEIL